MNAATCRHCDRSIVLDDDGRWIDPEAGYDDENGDGMWRETCDAHDTFTAEHEPAVPNRMSALDDAARNAGTITLHYAILVTVPVDANMSHVDRAIWESTGDVLGTLGANGIHTAGLTVEARSQITPTVLRSEVTR